MGVMRMYFDYGETELSYLRKKDKRLCEVIDQVGHIYRAADPDLFSAVIHHIIGQQISTKAQDTVWRRMRETLGDVNAETILSAGAADGLSPSGDQPGAVREVPPPLSPLRQRGEPLPLGGGRRRDPENEGPRRREWRKMK